ncbi:hypothetical protein BJI69_09345 [Luteibacter rhizovicinus DSM 16549]|uniref:Uncharacterized protein n=1 Tax=Luteibacter rhizovicinus DSM 16549 TaxID=1440763 RepID=A0A1L3ESN7_9GAMM|nr:hypothetical protein [Luteibacter rhizovicinus]APG04078.1 hypothetical protein BJI69_09345 [Luteibacter rhizovicinus DSM 16549]
MAKKDPTSTSKEIVPVSAERGESPVAKAILEFVSRIPESEVPRVKGDAAEECRRLASSAAQKAAITAGSLALPPGPLGWLTVLPELVAIWRIQGQLVSDIAAAYGKTPKLGREQMLWCLFRHTAAQAFRDVAIRVGDRLVFRTTATSVLQRLAGRIGVSVSKRAVGKGISRWLPVVGALGVGAYAYYDTGQVAKTAIDLFSGEIHIDDDPDGSEPNGREQGKTSRARKGTATPDAKAPVGAGSAGDPPAPKTAARKTSPAATRKRATTKKTVARKSVATKATKVAKPAAKKAAAKATSKATKKVTARRAPAKKTAARKPRAAT